MSTKLVDPMRLLRETAAARALTTTELAATDTGADYEIPLEPRPGTRLVSMTIASTYRTPISVLFDPASKTTFPVTNRD